MSEIGEAKLGYDHRLHSGRFPEDETIKVQLKVEQKLLLIIFTELTVGKPV